MYKLMVLFIIFCNFIFYPSNSQAKIELGKLYIGQPYWDAYEILKTNPEHQSGIPWIEFDKNWKIRSMRFSPINWVYNSQDDPYYISYEEVNKIINDIVNNFNGKCNIEKIEFNEPISDFNKFKNGTLYIISDNDDRMTFFVDEGENGEYLISNVVLEPNVKLTGPVIKGVQLGMDSESATKIFKKNGYTPGINRFLYGKGKYINPKDTEIVYGIIFDDMRKVFDIEELNDEMVNKFLEAYKIKAKKLPSDSIYKIFNVDSLADLQSLNPYINTSFGNNSKVDIYEGNDYYIMFIQNGEYNNSNFHGLVYLVHKEAIPYIPVSLPKHNKPNFN